MNIAYRRNTKWIVLYYAIWCLLGVDLAKPWAFTSCHGRLSDITKAEKLGQKLFCCWLTPFSICFRHSCTVFTVCTCSTKYNPYELFSLNVCLLDRWPPSQKWWWNSKLQKISNKQSLKHKGLRGWVISCIIHIYLIFS